MSELSEHGTNDEAIEDCDCHRCALEFRNRYKRALAGISEEMGLPPAMGPATGDLKRLLDAGKEAIEQLRAAPVAVSAEADFDAMTWTFQIGSECRISGGVYALVWLRPNVSDEGPPVGGPSRSTGSAATPPERN